MKYINTFNDGDNIAGIYLCKQKNTATTKNGKEYENVTLCDKTGSISCKIWDPSSMGIDWFEVNDYVDIHGRVSLFNNALQVSIDRARKAGEGSYNPADYLPVSDKDPDEMYAQLISYVNSINASYYKGLLHAFFLDEDFKAAFMRHSAAKSIHHSFVGGLLEHTLSVCRLCDFYATQYDFLDRDLLITAALCHDIGKVKELSDFPANDYTDSGQLLGHIVIGSVMVSEKAAKIGDFPKVKLDELLHCILAHHGEFEFGSPKKPALIEAIALNKADDTDAKLESMKEALFSPTVEKGQWLGFNKIFDSNIRSTL